jgi:citrate synthase
MWISAADAARLLGVTRATLYAYVSRGYVRSQSGAGASRERRYARDDVERLRQRTEARRDPQKAAARALHWGVPVIESSITMIDGHSLYYRGHDVATLARERSIGEVASLIWTGRFETELESQSGRPQVDDGSLDPELPFIPRAQTLLAVESTRDATAFLADATSTAHCGWRILHVLTHAATGRWTPLTIDDALARAWRVGRANVDLLRSALILCADHELNVSAFTARSVASAGSSPYAVVIAGLAALEGIRHGGASARVESMIGSMRVRLKPGATYAQSVRQAIAERLRRGESLDGFGHPLYPHGDPRATLLLNLLRERYPKSAELRFVLDVASAATAAVRHEPNLDFALAALARVLSLPSGAPLTIFAIGRTIGWIGHAIEQYATGQLIRPRAKYVGVSPNSVMVRLTPDTTGNDQAPARALK